MVLQVKPFRKNLYPKTGILIRNTSPYVWLKEIEMMDIDLEKTRAYAIPSDKVNVLYGCFLILKNHFPKETGGNLYYQCVNNKVFIPEYSIISPQIGDEDLIVLTSDFYIMSPEFGLVELIETIDWTSIIHAEHISKNIEIQKPEPGIRTPSLIKEYILEIDETKFIEELTSTKTEEEWIKDLPFNLQKVLAGNNREFKKYLKYIEKYPDRAVDLGVPLDVTNSSRGEGWSSYTFNTPIFDKFSQKLNKLSNSPYRWTLYPLCFILIKWSTTFLLNADKNNFERNTSSFEMILLSISLIGFSCFYLFLFKKKSVNFGGNTVSLKNKILLMIILLGMIIYLFSSLIERFGYNWFTSVFILFCILILLRLFNNDKTILNKDDEK